MEGVRLVPLVLFVGFFAALFYAYYQAMKKIKQRENTLEPLVPLFGNSRNLICSMLCAWKSRSRVQWFCFVSANPTTDIWSISGNRQNSNDFSWPTHDAHVSIDSFVITSDTLNAAKTSVPPPPYSECKYI